MTADFPALSVLSAMITPAVLISACGTLLLSTSHRLGRVVDQVRGWSDQLEAMAREPTDDGLDHEKRIMVFAQLDDTASRARLLQWGMTALYLAVAVFVADSVVIGLVALAHIGVTWPTVVLGLLGGGLLFFGSMMLILEARLALATTRREMDYLRHLGQQRLPTELLERHQARPTPFQIVRRGGKRNVEQPLLDSEDGYANRSSVSG